MYTLYITTMPGAWRWQLCKTLVTYTPENAKRAQRKFIWWTRKYEHFGEKSYTSRWRIIAQAQVFSAFTSPEAEVDIIQRWLIVTSLQRGGFTDPGHINVVLREIPCEDKCYFLNVKMKGEIENGCSISSFSLRAYTGERCDNVGCTLRRAV